MVQGDAGDTLWVVVDKGYRDYYYRPYAYDTNGTVDTFYFSQTSNINDAVKTTIDSMIYNVSDLTVNRGSVRYIWVKDDDGFVTGGIFRVYADSAPPVPSLVGPPADSMVNAGGSVTLRWKKDDVHDRKETKFQVVLWNVAGDTTRVDWTPGTTYFTNNDGTDNHFAYTYTPNYPASRTVFWRVDAKDAQESSTKGSQLQFLYVKP